jgi:hypothetical protein
VREKVRVLSRDPFARDTGEPTFETSAQIAPGGQPDGDVVEKVSVIVAM